MNFWSTLSSKIKLISTVILTLILIGGIYLIFINFGSLSISLKDFSGQPRPAPILPTGKQIYEVIQQDFVYQPKVRFISLDPVDPKEGQEQKIIAQIDAYSKPTEVTSFVQVDGKSLELEFTEVQKPTLNLKQRYFVGDDNNLTSYTGQKIFREDITNKFNERVGMVTAVNFSTTSYVGTGVAPTSTTIKSTEPKNTAKEAKTELKTYEYFATWKVSKSFSEAPAISVSVKEEFPSIVQKSNPLLKIDPKVGVTKEIAAYAKKNRIPLSISESSKQIILTNVSMSWSAPCQIALGGNWESDSECAVSYPDGVDGGNLLVRQTSNLLSDADLAVNPGKSVVFSRDGKIIINTTKEIKESYLWKKVGDSSGVEEVIAGQAPSKDYLRRYEFDNQKDAEFRGLNANGEIFKIPTGKQVFMASGGGVGLPKIIQLDIDPLDVKPGDIQTMKVITQSENDISSVVARIETDKGFIDVPLAFEGKTAQEDILPNPYLINEKNELVILPVKKEADNIAKSSFLNVSEAKGNERFTYSGSWVVKDTIAKKYRTTFTIVDALGKQNSLTMAWSDPCGTAYSYTDTLYTANCSSAQVQGAARGNLNIGRVSPVANPTITILNNGRLFFTPGYKLSLIGSSTIVINNGGQIRNAYAAGYDQDDDRYAINAISLSDTAPTGYYRNLSTTDEYWSDCVDTDANVRPGAGTFYEPGSNGWDYDCDGVTRAYTSLFTASCEGDSNGCSVCLAYYLYCYGGWSCAYGGSTAGIGGNWGCGCGNEYYDGCDSSGGPGVGGCEGESTSCNGYFPNLVDSNACVACN